MQVKSVRAGQGWRWVLEGFSLLGRRPLAVLGMSILFLFTLVLTTLLPLVGAIAPLILTPALAVGFMQAVRMIDSGQMPSPLTLYSGLFASQAARGPGAPARTPGPSGPSGSIGAGGSRGAAGWQMLLVLGGFNAGLTLLVLALTLFADGGTLFEMVSGAIEPDDPRLAERSLLWAGIMFLIAYLPVQMAMWYAPVFVSWHRITPVKALFFSFVAVWRNKAAFVVYALGWLLVLVSLSLAVQLLRAAFSETVMPLVLSPVSIALLGTLYCSFWPTYRDAIVVEPD